MDTTTPQTITLPAPDGTEVEWTIEECHELPGPIAYLVGKTHGLILYNADYDLRRRFAVYAEFLGEVIVDTTDVEPVPNLDDLKAKHEAEKASDEARFDRLTVAIEELTNAVNRLSAFVELQVIDKV